MGGVGHRHRQPLGALQLEGRDVYIREGCYTCHSQMIRPLRAETERYGEYSKPGEFVFDHPFLWGSRRIGPDLARTGRRLPSPHWHVRHFLNPPDTSAGSIMPPYPHLIEKPLDFTQAARSVAAMKASTGLRCQAFGKADTGGTAGRFGAMKAQCSS